MIQLATVGGEHLARPSACATKTRASYERLQQNRYLSREVPGRGYLKLDQTAVKNGCTRGPRFSVLSSIAVLCCVHCASSVRPELRWHLSVLLLDNMPICGCRTRGGNRKWTTTSMLFVFFFWPPASEAFQTTLFLRGPYRSAQARSLHSKSRTCNDGESFRGQGNGNNKLVSPRCSSGNTPPHCDSKLQARPCCMLSGQNACWVAQVPKMFPSFVERVSRR